MRILISIILTVFSSVWLIAQTANPNANTKTKQTLQYFNALKSATTNNILLGQNIGHGGEVTNYINTLVNNLQQQTGKYIGMIGADYGLDPSVNYAQANQVLIDYSNAGGIITLSWHMDNPWTGGNTWDTNNNENLNDLITPGNNAYNNWQSELQNLANVLQQLEDANVTVLWRPLHEMTGNWFWWGHKNFTGHEQAYINVWRNMYDYLTITRGLDNLLWVYSTANTWEQRVTNYYPGAGYVDIVGIDIYDENVDTWFPSRDYQDLQSLGHPMGINEFGPPISSANGNYDYRRLLTNMKAKYPDFVFAHAWHDWNENGGLVAMSFIENQFVNQVFADPCVATRDEIVLGTPPTACDWQLVWEDNFDGSTLAAHWSHQTGAGGWGNGELQSYTSSTANSFVQNGNLNIVAREDSPGSYSSARLRSINNGDWKYGRMEARIKLPVGQGIWPAFWMMPTDAPYGSWPASGEIDIMEFLGHEPQHCYTFCHYGNSPNDKGSLGTQHTAQGGDYTSTFHEFAVEWQENKIDWFIDGTLVFSANNTQTAPYQWPFDSRFHFILNIAVGGGWPGAPDNTTSFPQTMLVDYVKVYQKPQDFTIVGAVKQFPNTTGTVYSVPVIQGATYAWNVPACANLMSGQGTNEIMVNWANAGGDITVDILLPCGTYSKSTTVEVTKNLLVNADFDTDFSGWYFNTNGGAVANQYFDTQNPYNGARSVCADITVAGADPWNIQLLPNTISVTANTTYSLSFYARANVNGKPLEVSFRNTNGHIWQGGTSFILTNSWAYYNYNFTAPNTVADLSVDFNMGNQTGTFCFDDILFELPGPTTGPCITNCLDLELDVWLEGVYDLATNSMTTELYNRTLLPNGQPYNTAPWNYPGLEGNGWSINDYPQGTVDWVLLSFRNGISSNSTVLRKAGILLSDGRVVLVDGCIEPAELPDASYYVLVEHRNHVGAMTVAPVNVSNGRIIHDYRTQDSYNGNGSATGQKQVDNSVWALIAGDVDQSDSPSYDVNAADKSLWSLDNGMFNVYNGADVNQDGDINGLDRILWQYNSGIFSAVPR